MADNFRHAQYRGDGTQIDDPQKIGDLTAAQVAALQALVSGAGIGIRLTDPSDANLRRKLLSLAVSTIWLDATLPMATGCTKAPIYRTYIDPVNGDDSWDGTSGSFAGGSVGPKRTAATASWTGTKTSRFSDEILLFRAGTTYTHADAANPLSVSSTQSLGAYWLLGDDPSSRPTIRSMNSAGSGSSKCVIGGSGTLSDLMICDLIIDGQDVPNRNGISLYQYADGQTVNNITVRNCKVINQTVNDGNWYAGIKVEYFGNYSRSAAYGTSTNILCVDCEAIGLGAHGFAFNGSLGQKDATTGRWYGVDVVSCLADGCGVGKDSHGFTSYAGGVLTAWVSGSWVNSAGTIYYRDMSVQYGRSIPDVAVCYMARPDGEVHQLVQNTATPTAPAIGEYGFDSAAQRMYVNSNEAITSAFSFTTYVRPARGIRYIGCIARNTQHGTGGGAGTLEAIGIALDDGTSDCSVLSCLSYGNAGMALSSNRGNNNRIVGCDLSGSGNSAVVRMIFGWGHIISRCSLNAISGSYSVDSTNYGAMFAWHASIRGYRGTTTAQAPFTFSRMSDCRLTLGSYTGAVSAILGASSVNAPPWFVDGCDIANGPAGPVKGAAFMRGRRASGASLDVPAHLALI